MFKRPRVAHIGDPTVGHFMFHIMLMSGLSDSIHAFTPRIMSTGVYTISSGELSCLALIRQISMARCVLVGKHLGTF